jgi:hypothetical protein
VSYLVRGLVEIRLYRIRYKYENIAKYLVDNISTCCALSKRSHKAIFHVWCLNKGKEMLPYSILRYIRTIFSYSQ